MQETIRAAVLRLFPELSGGLHLDRYARVVAIADQPGEGATCERFRPRYAVDIEILTADMEPDPAYPVYPAVPLPVSCGAGQESGTFAYPEPGALVVVGFAYGRPDHPVIRQVYPLGVSLPGVAPREWLAQQSPTVFQRADAGGNWTRTTDATITDDSVSRIVRAVDATTDLARELRRISEHSTTEVGGMATLEAGTVLTMLAGIRADLGTLGALNLTSGAGATLTVGEGLQETVGADRTTAVRGARATTIGGADTLSVGADRAANIAGASTETVEGEKSINAANITLAAQGTICCKAGQGSGTSLFAELLACLDEIRAALDVLAGHTHPDAGTIDQGAAVSGHAARLGGHRATIGGITR